ncbi:hypothetical protein BFW87_20720 [Pseudomonas fluorescens]|uniref:Uncharacterized protein n=1 Tax=Pseudomonas fluorescens TaxID=294 RepID=A0A1T2YH70_PSEFL|nr:hypothetical protein BFW87_20720 [Pseudomonas fluorescens]
MGHPWPSAANPASCRVAHGFKPACGHTERERGAEWWGEAFLVTFGALPKVTRCKSGTNTSRYRSNGYVLRTNTPAN